MYISKNLNYLKRVKNILQKDLAIRIGKERANVNKYFTGKVMPPVDVLNEICKVYEVNLHDIVNKDMEEEGYLPSLDTAEVITIISDDLGPGTKDIELRFRKIEDEIKDIRQRL